MSRFDTTANRTDPHRTRGGWARPGNGVPRYPTRRMPQFARGSDALGWLPRPPQPERMQDREDLARLVTRLEAFTADPDPGKRATSAVLLAKLRLQIEKPRPSG